MNQPSKLLTTIITVIAIIVLIAVVVIAVRTNRSKYQPPEPIPTKIASEVPFTPPIYPSNGGEK